MVPSTFFYTKEPVFKEVTKEEFDEFVANYPRHLEVNSFAAYTPPLLTYNDFDLADRWPYSVVARTLEYDEDPYCYHPEGERIYEIMENYKEVFASKTGKMVD